MQFSINQLERLVAEQGIEKGGEHERSRDHIGHAPSYDPPPRERDIRRTIYDFIYKSDGWVQRSDIASALKLKKTRWLHDHIEGLVNDGYIVKTESIRYNGMKQYWYGRVV